MTADDPITTKLVELCAIGSELEALRDMFSERASKAKGLEDFVDAVRAAWHAEMSHVDEVDLDVADMIAGAIDSLKDMPTDIQRTADALSSVLDDARDLAEYCSALFGALAGEDLDALDLEAKRTAERILRQLPIGVEPPEAK